MLVLIEALSWKVSDCSWVIDEGEVDNRGAAGGMPVAAEDCNSRCLTSIRFSFVVPCNRKYNSKQASDRFSHVLMAIVWTFFRNKT